MINRQYFKLEKSCLLTILLLVFVFGGFFSNNGYVCVAAPGNKIKVTQHGNGPLIDANTGKVVGSPGNIHGVPNPFDRTGSDVVDMFAKFLDLATDLLSWTISPDLYENVFFSKPAKTAVIGAWRIVQGFVNMFYILILLFLAIATILQINGFNDKKLFIKVLLSAILVNFSLPITIFVIDASNIFMNYFATAISGTNVTANFLNNSEYAKITSDLGFFQKAGMDLFGVIIYVIMTVMILWTAAALLIRLIAYWVLIILSPLAFFALAIPGSAGFNEWKNKLVHYSFFGPIMLFFIWLALYLMKSLNLAYKKHPGIASHNKFILFLVGYITAIYLLYYGHEKSRDMANKAGDTVGKIMGKSWDHGFKAAKFVATGGPAGMIASSYAKSAYVGGKALLNKHKATAWMTKEGREKTKKNRDEMAKSLITGKGSLKERYERTKARQELREINEKEKEMTEAGYDLDNVEELKRLREKGGLEGQVAAKKLADKNKLAGDELEKSLDAAGDNELLRKHILAKAGEKNKVALMEYHYKNRNNNEESKKFIDDMRKKAIEEFNKNTGSSYDAEKLLDRRAVERQIAINRGISQEEARKQMAYNGMFAGATSVNKTADILNEDSGKQGEEATQAFANYAQDRNFGEERYNREGGRAKDMLNNNLNSKASAELRNRGFL